VWDVLKRAGKIVERRKKRLCCGKKERERVWVLSTALCAEAVEEDRAQR
jgi:hypothetical protein